MPLDLKMNHGVWHCFVLTGICLFHKFLGLETLAMNKHIKSHASPGIIIWHLNQMTKSLSYIFIYFQLCWVFFAVWGLSSAEEVEATLWLWCAGFSFWWLPLLQITGSWHMGFSSCSIWAQQLWHKGLATPQHVKSSQTRDRTGSPGPEGRFLSAIPAYPLSTISTMCYATIPLPGKSYLSLNSTQDWSISDMIFTILRRSLSDWLVFVKS